MLMKDLLKQYIEKGYEPAFYNKKINVYAHYTSKTFNGKVEKLELYLMRDWLEEKHSIWPYIVSDWDGKETTWVVSNIGYTNQGQPYDRLFKFKYGNWPFDKIRFYSSIEALKAALEEAIKHI